MIGYNLLANFAMLPRELRKRHWLVIASWGKLLMKRLKYSIPSEGIPT